MQTSKLSASLKLAAVSAALAVCGASFAAQSPAPAASSQESPAVVSGAHADKAGEPHKHMHKHMRRHMRDAAMWVPGYGPLGKDFVQSLALNDSQNALIDAAKAEQKEARTQRREAMRSSMKAKAEQAKAGKLDPRAALKQGEQAQEKALAERGKINEKWLAVWDALDATQQQKVAAHFSERAEKFAKRAEKRKEHRQQAVPAAAAEKASS
ncbi:MAG: hypothetical protein WBA83_11585 [Burkholderiaceae bacterium]